MYKSFTKQNIVIIGGSSGIGKATAKMAAELGNQVVLTSRTKDRAGEAAAEIGEGTQGFALDVNNFEDVQSFFEQLDSIDHVYIAAGSTQTGGFMEGKLHGYLETFNTRFMGSLAVARAAIPKIKSNGSIVFTGGISTDRPIGGAWISGLGTAVAEQLARVLVMEFPSLRFNAVSPGYTDTPMWDEILGEQKISILQQVAQKIPTQRLASPEEVASAILLLMSNKSINGEVLHVDGGARLV